MSSAPAERLAPVRSNPEAPERARLAVVPRSRVRAPKLPFVLLISVMLIGGIVGLLCFNTSMQQASFAAANLEEQATSLEARQETLKMELEELRDPQQIAVKARRQGMVIPNQVATLDVATGKVGGTPQAAQEGNTPKLWPSIRKPKFPGATTAEQDAAQEQAGEQTQQQQARQAERETEQAQRQQRLQQTPQPPSGRRSAGQ